MTQEIIEKPMSAECTMKQYEAILDADFVENREYQLTDYPDNGANAEQMAYALTCQRLFSAGTVITFSGTTDSNYTNGHLYQIQVDTSGTKSWKDITPVSEQSIPIITGTQDKPINLATDLEVGKWYLLTGYVYYSASRNILLKASSTPTKTELAYVLTYKDDNNTITFKDYNFRGGYCTVGVDALVTILHDGAINSVKSTVSIARMNNLVYSGPISFYAPTDSGTANQILKSNGESKAPTWVDPATIGLATTADIEAAIGNVSALLGDTSDLEV